MANIQCKHVKHQADYEIFIQEGNADRSLPKVNLVLTEPFFNWQELCACNSVLALQLLFIIHDDMPLLLFV